MSCMWRFGCNRLAVKDGLCREHELKRAVAEFVICEAIDKSVDKYHGSEQHSQSDRRAQNSSSGQSTQRINNVEVSERSRRREVARSAYEDSLPDLACNGHYDEYYDDSTDKPRISSGRRKREEQYRVWSQNIKERSFKSRPVNENEAWSFIIDKRGLRIWEAVARIIGYTSSDGYTFDPANFDKKRQESTVFVNLGQQLLQNALAVNIVVLDKLREDLDAIKLQLIVLGSFGDLYYRDWDDVNRGLIRRDFSWHHDLRPNILEAVKQADRQKVRSNRSPLQHHQDNVVLQAIICAFLLGCIYPLVRVLKSSSPTPGSTSDADFWVQVTNTIIQLAGFLTLLLPIYRETAAKQWVGTWILTVLGTLSAGVAVPLYLFAPIWWSAFFSWLASAAQLLVVLQVALVATFRDEEHAKRD
ncbi:MAG: hypothetical protein M1836_002480 [Candelina mexicana]|nr:MAG: hypothetical protein M1836_002480 [Candelina mexicana]